MKRKRKKPLEQSRGFDNYFQIGNSCTSADLADVKRGQFWAINEWLIAPSSEIGHKKATSFIYETSGLDGHDSQAIPEENRNQWAR